jgi:Lysylphosphatidylglycerol synthase TM region
MRSATSTRYDGRFAEMPDPQPRLRRRVTPTGILAAIFGTALFIYTLQRTSLPPIIDGLKSVGWGFLLILALSGLRFLARTAAWRLCTEGGTELRLRDAFSAFVTGDALGNLTPLGLIVSEPTKAMFVRHRLSLMAAVSGLAIENLIYSFTVAIVIAAGTSALLLSFNVSHALRMASTVALIGVAALLAVAAWVLGRNVKIVSGLVDWLRRRRLAPAALSDRLEKLRLLEDSIYGFHRRHPERLLLVLGLEAAYHAAGVAEVFVTLTWLVAPPTLFAAFILESANRATNVVFKFVPMRLGVDEAGSGILTSVLGYSSAAGVTLAIVRKVRMLFWTAVGVFLLARRGLTAPEAVVDPTA